MMKIFTAYYIKDLELKNRIIMAPMCMYESDDQGFVKPFHLAHYPARAYGGVSLIIQEATAVTPNGRISGNDLGIWRDEHIEGLKSIVDNVHIAGAKMGIQLSHAGRKCSVQDAKIVAPSAIGYSERYKVPHALSIEEIKDIVESFKSAAIRAKKVGYDLIEVHAAHGYLINQFISPLANKREDIYGGNIANRARFLKEVLLAIKEVWDGPLTIRVSAEEYASDGHSVKETLEVLNEVKHFDAVNVSTGGVIYAVPEVYEGYQLKAAETIKKAGFMVIGGGFIRNPHFIENALQEHKVDFMFLGRELLLNPYFVLRLAKKVKPELVIPAYRRSFD
jgi:NADPH2 dehydrogenase